MNTRQMSSLKTSAECLERRVNLSGKDTLLQTGTKKKLLIQIICRLTKTEYIFYRQNAVVDRAMAFFIACFWRNHEKHIQRTKKETKGKKEHPDPQKSAMGTA